MTGRRRNYLSKTEIEELAYDRQQARRERNANASRRYHFLKNDPSRPTPSLPRLKFLEGRDL